MSEDRIKQMLKRSLPPVGSGAEPARDLWPALLSKLDEDTAAAPRVAFAIPWLDWALLGGLVVFAASFPATIPLFLYYL